MAYISQVDNYQDIPDSLVQQAQQQQMGQGAQQPPNVMPQGLLQQAAQQNPSSTNPSFPQVQVGQDQDPSDNVYNSLIQSNAASVGTGNPNTNSFSPMSSQQSTPADPAPRPQMPPMLGSRAAVEGYLAARQLSREEDANNRANSTQGMQEQAFNWMKEDHNRATAVRNGMSSAAQQGGFPAVMDYLTVADPNAALAFGDKKADLDLKIMNNQTYQIAHSNDKATAMMQAYQLLGGMGSTLLKTPGDQRASAYQSMLPMMKQIVPDMPDQLDSTAVNHLMLGMSLSTPAAILYNGQKQAVQYHSDTGKLLGDLQQASSMYGSDSPQAQALQTQLQNTQMSAQKNQLMMANTVAKDTSDGEKNLRQQYIDLNKGFTNTMQRNSAIQNAINPGLNKDGKPLPADDLALVYNYYKLLSPSARIGPGQMADAENTEGWTDSQRTKYNNLMNGARLGEDERKGFAESAQKMADSQSLGYYSTKAQFRDIAMNNHYNPDNVLIEQAEPYIRPPDKAIQFLQQNPTPEMKQQFQFKYGQSNLIHALQPQGQATPQQPSTNPVQVMGLPQQQSSSPEVDYGKY